MHTILHRLLRTFCAQLPLPVMYRLLESYHAVLARMQSGFSAARWKADGNAVPLSAHARSRERARAFMARVTAAARGVVRVFVAVLDTMTDMHVLRRLVRFRCCSACMDACPVLCTCVGRPPRCLCQLVPACLSSGRTRCTLFAAPGSYSEWLQEAQGPAGSLLGGQGTPEQNLEEYAHVAVAACALLHHRTLLSAPRIVMNMSFYSTHVLSRLDDEVRTPLPPPCANRVHPISAPAQQAGRPGILDPSHACAPACEYVCT